MMPLPRFDLSDLRHSPFDEAVIIKQEKEPAVADYLTRLIRALLLAALVAGGAWVLWLSRSETAHCDEGSPAALFTRCNANWR